MHRHTTFRGWAILWAVLQFALPAAASFADARLEREGSLVLAHAESRSDASCRPVHAAECALCQLVWRASAAAAQTASTVAVVRAVDEPSIAERPWHALVGLAGLAPARAPPLS